MREFGDKAGLNLFFTRARRIRRRIGVSNRLLLPLRNDVQLVGKQFCPSGSSLDLSACGFWNRAPLDEHDGEKADLVLFGYRYPDPFYYFLGIKLRVLIYLLDENDPFLVVEIYRKSRARRQHKRRVR